MAAQAAAAHGRASLPATLQKRGSHDLFRLDQSRQRQRPARRLLRGRAHAVGHQGSQNAATPRPDRKAGANPWQRAIAQPSPASFSGRRRRSPWGPPSRRSLRRRAVFCDAGRRPARLQRWLAPDRPLLRRRLRQRLLRPLGFNGSARAPGAPFRYRPRLARTPPSWETQQRPPWKPADSSGNAPGPRRGVHEGRSACSHRRRPADGARRRPDHAAPVVQRPQVRPPMKARHPWARRGPTGLTTRDRGRGSDPRRCHHLQFGGHPPAPGRRRWQPNCAGRSHGPARRLRLRG